MRVAIVNSSDIVGGAAKAAYRLHRGLLEHGVFCKMFVARKTSTDSSVVVSNRSLLRRGASAVSVRVLARRLHRHRNRAPSTFSVTRHCDSRILEDLVAFDPDIVHLHWVADGTIDLARLADIRKPIVWTLHDMWALTGGCHYSGSCTKYKVECHRCPLLGSDRYRDASNKSFQKKRSVLLRVDRLVFCGPSTWIANNARESTIATSREVVTVPNVIDTDLFRPIDRDFAKELLGVRPNSKLVVFGAMGPISDSRKGFAELMASLEIIGIPGLEVAIFGLDPTDAIGSVRFAVRMLGYFQDEISLVALYNAADVVVVPSREENLSNTILESLSCGTPVVAFDIGGNSDLVDHLENGYLARPNDLQDFARGIEWVLSDRDRYTTMRQAARDKTRRSFDRSVVVPQHVQLYQSILAQSAR